MDAQRDIFYLFLIIKNTLKFNDEDNKMSQECLVKECIIRKVRLLHEKQFIYIKMPNGKRKIKTIINKTIQQLLYS